MCAASSYYNHKIVKCELSELEYRSLENKSDSDVKLDGSEINIMSQGLNQGLIRTSTEGRTGIEQLAYRKEPQTNAQRNFHKILKKSLSHLVARMLMNSCSIWYSFTVRLNLNEEKLVAIYKGTRNMMSKYWL
jgi:hypothetical protein